MLNDLKETRNERNRRYRNEMEHLDQENTISEMKNSLDEKSS